MSASEPMTHPGAEARANARKMAEQRVNDPGAIITAGLTRLIEADMLHGLLHGQPYSTYTQTTRGQLSDQMVAAVELAATFAVVADTVVTMQREQREADRVAAVVEAADPVEPGPEYVPQPVQGVRFRADLHPARGQYMGMIGGNEWFHLPGRGFIDISTAEESGSDNAYELTGRIVSATPDHILGITDGGVGVTLPRDMVIWTVDE
jgi:hypothetical protein